MDWQGANKTQTRNLGSSLSRTDSLGTLPEPQPPYGGEVTALRSADNAVGVTQVKGCYDFPELIYYLGSHCSLSL